MSKLRCIIIDDEKLARVLLKNYIVEIPDLILIGAFKSPSNAQKIIEEDAVDLIFLDIQMPEISGLDFLKKLKKNPFVIFTTAYPHFALDGFELNAMDYLLKPFRFERFQKAVQKVIRLFELVEDQKKFNKLKNEGDGKHQQDFILIKSEYKVFKVFFEEILFIEGMREYVAFHIGNQRVLTLMSLKSLEKMLPSDQFIRVHKSYIINRFKVISKKSNQIFIGEKKIPVGISFRKNVDNNLF